jgi:adenine-specific DNA-methyltransferase
VREIGEDIIDFLSQTEEFQKRLWEKKKFVLKTEYVITTDRVPEEFYQEIWTNKDQKNEWKDLGFDIPETKKDLRKRTLPIDTKYFSTEFKEKLLEKLTEMADLDDLLDGLLIKSENWQALNTILPKYKEKVKCIYIDPPYNTGNDEFLYRDRYQHSSWISMMENRLGLVKGLMTEDGVIFVSIDDNEVDSLKLLLKQFFSFTESLIWRKAHERYGKMKNTKTVRIEHDYILFSYPANVVFNKINIVPKFNQKPKQDEKGKFYVGYIARGEKGSNPEHANYYTVHSPNGKEFTAQFEIPKEEFLKLDKEGKIYWTETGISYRKIYLDELREVVMPSILYDNEEYGTTYEAHKKFIDLNMSWSEFVSDLNPKPLSLLKHICESSSEKESLILDFFAGSGTTAHACMKLNKEDGGKRKFIIVEMANYLDTVIIPRLKKICYSFNWKDEKPQDTDGISQFFKYQILEQYEDALDNIELVSNKQAELKFGDDYLLKYFLDYETRENPSLLNIDQLKNPFSYKLKVNPEEVGEPQEMIVDIPETFNYLLGLKVKKIKAKYSPLKKGNKYLFVLGEKEAKDVAIVWREYNDNWTEDDFKKDKEFIIQELEPWSPYVVYVNGQSVLTPEIGKHTAEIHYIEPEFKKLME